MGGGGVGLLPTDVLTVRDVFSTLPEEEPRRWADAYASDFLRAWEECPDPDWLIVFALVASSRCSDATKQIVGDAIDHAHGARTASAKPPSAAERDALARGLAGDVSGVELFRGAGGGRHRSPDTIVRDLRRMLPGPAILKEAALAP